MASQSIEASIVWSSSLMANGGGACRFIGMRNGRGIRSRRNIWGSSPLRKKQRQKTAGALTASRSPGSCAPAFFECQRHGYEGKLQRSEDLREAGTTTARERPRNLSQRLSASRQRHPEPETKLFLRGIGQGEKDAIVDGDAAGEERRRDCA